MKCILCDKESQIIQNHSLLFAVLYTCPECGRMGYEEGAWQNKLTEEIKFMASCYMKEKKLRGQDRIIIIDDSSRFKGSDVWAVISIDEMVDKYPRNAIESLERALINIGLQLKKPSERLSINDSIHRTIFCKDRSDVDYLLMQLVKKEYITEYSGFGNETNITINGWREIIRLNNSSINTRGNKVAFVAMSFSKTMYDIWKNGIEKAINSVFGYEALRIDSKEHNNKICDEIIAGIKSCDFMVADFTEQRGGVYFEAGFAQGLRKPVIWCVRSNDLANVHFDTRQYNHIVYSDENDLYEKLRNRIISTIR